MRDGVTVVIQRERSGSQGGAAILPMSVVQGGSPYPHDHIGRSPTGVNGIDQAALASDDHRRILIVDGIADEVRSRIEFPQITLGSVQFLLHNGDQDIVLSRVARGSPV